MGISVVPLVVIAMVPIITGSFGQRPFRKSTAGKDSIDIDDLYYSADDYPIFKSKRSVLLLDQLVVALQNLAKNQGKSLVGLRPRSPDELENDLESVPVKETDQTITSSMDLQRRGEIKDQALVAYWRCYLNAVSCFRRK